MGLFSKKKEVPTGKEACEQGYLSFNPEEIKQQAESNSPNSEAYDYLDKAMFTSSHVSVEDKKKGVVNIDDVYPVTMEETLEMEGYLAKAKNALKDTSDQFFKERYDELCYIVDWSKERHWTFSWKIILAVIVSLFIFKGCSESEQENANEYKTYVGMVENWAESDTTLSLSALDEYSAKHLNDIYDFKILFQDAKTYKLKHLGQKAYSYYSSNKSVATATAKLDTCTTEKSKQRVQESIEEYKKDAERYQKEFEELNATSFKDLKKEALEYTQGLVDGAEEEAGNMMFWFIFFIVMIPIYIIAERPYGYTISRYRTEAKVIGGIRKVAMWLSGGLIAGAGALQFTDIVTKWSDGTTTREDSGTGPAILVLKLALVAVAIVVICFTSCVIMTYSTVSGLIRNYPWTDWINKAKAAQSEKKA